MGNGDRMLDGRTTKQQVFTVAYIGSRDYSELWKIDMWLQSLHKHFTPDYDVVRVISGRARGPNKYAIQFAKSLGLSTREFKPDYRAYGKKAPLIRNTTIAENADWVVAFWDGKSSGTLDTMRKAKHLGKRVTVVPPDGDSVEWNE